MKYWAEQDNKSTLKGIMAYSLTQTKKILKKLLLVVSLCLVMAFGVGQLNVKTAEARTYSQSVMDHVDAFVDDLDSDSESIGGEEPLTNAQWDSLKNTAQDASDAFDRMIQSGWLEVDMIGLGEDEAGDDNWDDGIRNIKILDPRGGPLLREYLTKMRDMFKAQTDVVKSLEGAEDDEDDSEKNLNSLNNILAQADFDTLEVGQTLHDDDQLNGGYDIAITSADGSRDVITASDSGGPVKCGVTSGEELMGCVAWVTYTVLLKGSSLILYLVGVLFNMSLNLTLNIGELFLPNSGFGLGGSRGAVYLGWSTVRNFINIIFIFVLLYVAISTIVQNDKYGAKKMVTKIVVAALLINFSLFFTKAVIDLSNILALQFYARILESAKAVGSNPSDKDGGLSGAILNASGLRTVWTSMGADGQRLQYNPTEISMDQFARATGLNAYKLITISLFGGGFILVLSLVLFIGIAQFLMRTIVLLFLMITSPLGFIGEAIPALGGVASDWRKRLTNNAIFAPAYMAVLFVVCQIMFGDARADIVDGGGFRSLLTGNPQERAGSIGIAFWFFLITGLLLTGQGAARGFADKFGKGFVDKAEAAFKGKGKYGWRKGASWTGKKIGAGAKSGASWAGGKLSEGLRRTPGLNTLSKVLPKKTRDAWYQAGVDRAKDKANNLRRSTDESDEKYEARQADIIGKAQERQFKSMGLNRGDFENKGYSYTEDGVTYTKYKYGAINKDVAKKLKAKGEEKYLRSRRKRRNDSIERLEGAFGPAKAGSSDDVKSRLKKAKDDLKALQTNTHDSITAQLKQEVDDKALTIETILAAGGTVTKANRDDLKNAKKDLADHLAQQNKFEKDIAELSEKLEKIKKEEKDKAEKDKEKSKKK